jgi:hypothetical protein
MTLNQAQEAIVALLGKGGERPDVAPSMAADLSAALVEELAPHQHLWADGRKIWVHKHALASIHSCETHAVLEWDRDFEWTPAAARGVVSHKAIELMVHWQGEAPPSTMVDEAIARLIEGERGIGSYLGGLAPGERAELRSFAVTRVTTFDDSFPPLQPKWRPVTESPARVELFDGAVVLAAKTDLTLGRPGDKVIIDLKSGTTLGSHREDLRFYALIETIKLGVAPRKIATYYLDTARAHAEDVTEGLLWSALRRTVDGVVRIAELQRKVRPPEVRPGPTCRWCPLNTTCEPGIELLAKLDDPDVVSPW